MLLAQKAYVEGGMALGLYTALLVDEAATAQSEAARGAAARLLDLLTPVTKSWASQWCLAANDLAIQVHGGYGYTRDYNVEQFYRDNRLNAIHEGTHGIQAADLLGRKVGADGGAAMSILEARIEATVLKAQRSLVLSAHAAELRTAWHRIRETTERLAKIADPRLRLANAAVYLEAFGHVVVAWLWLDQSCAAERAAERDRGNNAQRGKLAACSYFFAWELPKIAAWTRVLDPVERTPIDLDETAF
jgi:alkylation response protein AidB-like acyl-CoA dehydrogenase